MATPVGTCARLGDVGPSSDLESINTVEEQVNGWYRHSNLTRESRSLAIWTVLTCAEDLTIRPIVQGREFTPQQDHAYSDYIINVVRYPLRWLSANTESGKPKPSFDAQRYEDGQRILDLAGNYEHFACAFSYLHHGAIELGLRGAVPKPIHQFLNQPEFEAYSFLSTNIEDHESIPVPEEVLGDFERRVRVKGSRFACDVNPVYARRLMDLLRPLFLKRFELPLDFRFSQYTLREFAEAYLVLFVVSLINFNGRLVAIQKGCENLGIVDSVIIHSSDQLTRRVARYSGLSAGTSRSIIQDLTYGAGGINYPDPAIQPLIPLFNGKLGIMPAIILGNSVERNLCVLLNRLTRERDGYQTLASQKESWLRNWILETLRDRPFRAWSGKVPGRKDLGDIDLALIDDEHETCLICELKWFISPSDPREWIEKSEEVAKGISQASALRRAFKEGCSSLTANLGISDHYRLSAIVLTPGWIGQSPLHSDAIPVLGYSHLAAKLLASDLPTTLAWLERREYLPVRGKHFSVVPRTFAVGPWELEWYQIKPLVAELFRPITS